MEDNYYKKILQKKGRFLDIRPFREDSKVSLIKIAKKELKNVVIQGGLNPKILLESDDLIFNAATKYITAFKDIPYICNLGHRLLPETDPDKVDKLIKFYRNFK